MWRFVYLLAKRCFIHFGSDAAIERESDLSVYGREVDNKNTFSIFSPSLYCFFPVNKKYIYFLCATIYPRNDVHIIFERKTCTESRSILRDDRKNH